MKPNGTEMEPNAEWTEALEDFFDAFLSQTPRIQECIALRMARRRVQALALSKTRPGAKCSDQDNSDDPWARWRAWMAQRKKDLRIDP